MEHLVSTRTSASVGHQVSLECLRCSCRRSTSTRLVPFVVSNWKAVSSCLCCTSTSRTDWPHDETCIWTAQRYFLLAPSGYVPPALAFGWTLLKCVAFGVMEIHLKNTSRPYSSRSHCTTAPSAWSTWLSACLLSSLNSWTSIFRIYLLLPIGGCTSAVSKATSLRRPSSKHS